MSLNWTTILKDIKETSINGKVHLHDLDLDHT